MASLMRLQAAKTLVEREREKIDDLMNRPALPSATVTTFGGLKRERLLQSVSKAADLGIVKRPKTEAIANAPHQSTKEAVQLNSAAQPEVAASSSSVKIINVNSSLVSSDYISSSSDGESDAP